MYHSVHMISTTLCAPSGLLISDSLDRNMMDDAWCVTVEAGSMRSEAQRVQLERDWHRE
ncbi:hypothetical protein PISMIDRAFT_672800 [Pisolithus microcarpus 441]|uniref:Uncharacterized protein n=1 Tax=Pisolithus microcarpus 441 TaxID=765257 RepID=A0A0D0ABC3_9AGAM|nr:hypothetical protein PISMIDRAFT_672800 [Pisolithus microcarpus 441]